MAVAPLRGGGGSVKRGSGLTRRTPLTSTATLQAGSGLQRRTPLQASGPITASTETKVKIPAPRAAPGHMRAAVAMVLAGERTVADAAREFSVDPSRLEKAAAAEFRRVVMERDSYTCLGDGAPAVDVQHRVARGMGGTSDPAIGFSPANGCGLCRSCHALCETRDEGMHARGLWLSQHQDPAEFPVFVLAEYGIEARYLLADGTYTLTDPREVVAS